MITPNFSLTSTERVLPKLSLDFTTASLDPRISFSRTGNTATRTNATGNIEVINANLPRFDYDPVNVGVCKGLLIEEQRTNIFTYSEQFDNAAWGKNNSTIASNVVTSPAGTMTADKLQETAVTNYFAINFNPSVSSSTVYTLSFYAKAAERSYVKANLTVSPAAVVFNLNNGTVFSSSGSSLVGSSIQYVGNGWYRCSATITTLSSGSNLFYGIIQLYNSSDNYTGTAGYGLYIWGAQLEAGAFPTSYIPTTTTALTRNADVATMTGTNFSDWYNQTQGSFEAEYSCNLTSGSDRRIVSVVDNSLFALNFISMFISNGAQKAASMNSFVGGSNIGRVDASQAFVANTTYKGMFSYKTNSRVITTSANTTSTSSSSFAPPALTIAFFGSNDTGSGSINGYLRKINYYNLAVTNAELQSFSK